jgi:hypothetical protein
MPSSAVLPTSRGTLLNLPSLIAAKISMGKTVPSVMSFTRILKQVKKQPIPGHDEIDEHVSNG